LNSIRAIKFYTAKGAPIESRRTSSGYMGDAAEVEMTVQTKDKLAAVEFDVWQNLRQVTVPFNVTVGLSLPGGRGGAAAEAASSAAASETAKPRPATPTIAPAPGEGAASVEAAVARLQSGAQPGKAGELLAALHPDDRSPFTQGIAMATTFSVMRHMSDEKASEKAQKEGAALFAKHKVKTPLNAEPAVLFKDTRPCRVHDRRVRVSAGAGSERTGPEQRAAAAQRQAYGREDRRGLRRGQAGWQRREARARQRPLVRPPRLEDMRIPQNSNCGHVWKNCFAPTTPKRSSSGLRALPAQEFVR
jgi:hypothetical protein